MGEVLVVDDSDDIRELIAMRVEHAGHHVTSIGDPRLALEAAARMHVDLALLDWSMPGMNGGELCARLHELPELAEVPVVIVTAHNDEDTRRSAAAAGASGYLTKPFTMRDLDAQVAEVLALRPRASEGPEVVDGLASA